MLFPILLLLLNVVHGDDVTCPQNFTYNPDLHTCLFFVSETVSWDVAHEDCLARGGFLISIHNAFQNALIAQITLDTIGQTESWLGVHFDEQNPAWRWSDGSTFDYNRFVQPVANCALVDCDCAFLLSDDQDWRNTACSDKHVYLCDAPPTINELKSN
ncbi:unnamed protein product, partial [Mesorhabditis belari]|uniref:C-type lectin domain-containing protein n=1 Tax=Mesorhabditis belari TaxID=2138241 RepID=A0AAF3EEH2_9BILA